MEMRRLNRYSNEGSGERLYTGRESSRGNLRGRPYAVCVPLLMYKMLLYCRGLLAEVPVSQPSFAKGLPA